MVISLGSQDGVMHLGELWFVFNDFCLTVKIIRVGIPTATGLGFATNLKGRICTNQHVDVENLYP